MTNGATLIEPLPTSLSGPDFESALVRRGGLSAMATLSATTDCALHGFSRSPVGPSKTMYGLVLQRLSRVQCRRTSSIGWWPKYCHGVTSRPVCVAYADTLRTGRAGRPSRERRTRHADDSGPGMSR